MLTELYLSNCGHLLARCGIELAGLTEGPCMRSSHVRPSLRDCPLLSFGWWAARTYRLLPLQSMLSLLMAGSVGSPTERSQAHAHRLHPAVQNTAHNPRHTAASASQDSRGNVRLHRAVGKWWTKTRKSCANLRRPHKLIVYVDPRHLQPISFLFANLRHHDSLENTSNNSQDAIRLSYA